jgi:SAM-dependent methyltransferase
MLMLRTMLRGVLPAPLRAIPRKVGGRVVDRFYGIRTEGWYRLTTSDRSRARWSDGISYQTCPYRVLWTVLRRLETNHDGVFYDLGCGRGRVVCVCAASGQFRKCIGIELVPTLADVARRNASQIRSRSPIEIVTGDSATANLGDGTVYFLFNPFGPDTCRAVLSNIQRTRNGKRVSVVCFGLYQREVYDECSWLECQSLSGRIGIWRSVPDSQPRLAHVDGMQQPPF